MYNEYIALFLFMVIVGITMFFYSSNSKNQNINTNRVNDTSGCRPEVFHLGQNQYTYDEAKQACAAFGSRLASLQELKDAYREGANWCSYGWSQDQLALYPIQKSFWDNIQSNPETKGKCRNPGLNGGYFGNNLYKFGANCYGIKPERTKKNLDENNFRCPKSKKKPNKYLNQKLKISPFNCSRWYK